MRDVVALAQPDNAQAETENPFLRIADQRAEHSDAVIEDAQLARQLIRRCRINDVRDQPGAGASFVHAELDESVLARRIDAVEKLYPRRNFFDVRSDLSNHATEDVIDLIEIVFQRSELRPRRDGLRSDAQIEIDVSVRASQ